MLDPSTLHKGDMLVDRPELVRVHDLCDSLLELCECERVELDGSHDDCSAVGSNEGLRNVCVNKGRGCGGGGEVVVFVVERGRVGRC